MDIDLLAKMVGELILEHDEVALPGVGTFVAEFVGAGFSDKGFTINPPYRKLSFRQREGDPSLLVDFYARTNQLEKSTAADILGKFLAEMKEVLKTKKYVVFPGLGRLRATKENLFFFVPDEDLNIYPEGFGLEPVSLKSHEELEEVTELAETAAAVAAIQGAPSDPAGAITPESAPPAAENALSGANALGFAPPADKTAVAPVIPPKEMADQVGHDASAAAPASATAPSAPASAAAPSAPASATAPSAPASATAPSAPASAAAPAEPVPAYAPKSETASEQHHHHHHHSSDGQSHSHSHSHSSDGQSHHHSHSHHHSSSSRRRKLPVWQKELLILLGFAAAFLIMLAVIGRVAPQFVDRFLYTREELEILYR